MSQRKPPRFIASSTNPRRPAGAYEMLRLFGVKGNKWPDRGCPVRWIQDIAVHVLPIDHESLRHPLKPGKARTRPHRCIASCPECGAAVSASRLAQHRCDARVSKAERLRRFEFQQTLAETRAAVAIAEANTSTPVEQLLQGRG